MKNEYGNSSSNNKIQYVLGTTVMTQYFSGLDTGGHFSLFENVAPASSQTPIHLHSEEDETFFMLEGEMTAILNGEDRPMRAGDSIFLPRLIPHQLRNKSNAPARYLLICTPSGFENFLEAAGGTLSLSSGPVTPSEEDIERMRSAAPRFGIKIFREWPTMQATALRGEQS